MLNHLICGTGTFHHQEEDGGPCSSPRKSKRKDHSRDNNPYSTRGLDKFSELLADLDQRRQKVYSQMSPQDISFVRFAYSSSNDFVPIVVKVKNNKDQKQHKSEEVKIRHLTSFSETMDVEERKQQHKLESDHKKTEKNNNFSFSWNKLKRPSFYVPAVMILILVFLTVFGRSVATLCTCVIWYIVPTFNGSSTKQRKWMMMKKKKKKKKDYVRGLSEKKMVITDGELSPRSPDSKSSRKHGHQKSW